MTCLVTGATGFVGSHLTRLLLSEGVRVAVLKRANSDPWRIEDVLEQVLVLEGDIVGADTWIQAVVELRPKAVFHLTWEGASRKARDHLRQIWSNVVPAARLAEAACMAGCEVWVGLGSRAEYGPLRDTLHEGLLPRPDTVYGAAKLASAILTEQICRKHGVRFVWARLFAAYGPMDAAEYLIPSIILSSIRGQRMALNNPQQEWDYLYVDDVARALWRLACCARAHGIFNLASGEPVTIRHIASTICSLLGRSEDFLPPQESPAPDQVGSFRVDVTRIKEMTGWRPETPLREGLRRTVEWFKQNAWRYGP